MILSFASKVVLQRRSGFASRVVVQLGSGFVSKVVVQLCLKTCSSLRSGFAACCEDGLALPSVEYSSFGLRPLTFWIAKSESMAQPGQRMSRLRKGKAHPHNRRLSRITGAARLLRQSPSFKSH
jgi:hypothetical protein